MATIVPTSEEDLILAVVRYTADIAWAEAGPEVADPHVARLCAEAENHFVAEKWLELANLMLTSAELVAAKVSDKDLECIYSIIADLVKRESRPEEALDMVKLISSRVSQHPDDRPALRFRILFKLYNLLETPYIKFFVYTKALELAASGKIPENIIPSFKKIDNLLREWNIGNLDQRNLFLTIANILKENKSMGKEYFTFLSRYLATFAGSNDELNEMNEAKEETVRAIIELVKSPDIFQCDLLDLPAVRQLDGDAKYSSVYQLLCIFLTQRLGVYLEFQAANTTLLKSYGLVHEDCISKMRLMSLLDLSSHCSGEIPYSLIKDTLQIDDDEVEYWLVKAITCKILKCKMDQMNQVVIVSWHTHRVFEKTHWMAIRSRLAAWRGSIGNTINTLRANKLLEEGNQSMQALMINQNGVV